MRPQRVRRRTRSAPREGEETAAPSGEDDPGPASLGDEGESAGLLGSGSGGVDLKASLVRLLLSMAAVVLLIYAVRWYLKRSPKRNGLPEGDMKALGYLRLGNYGVHEVSVGSRIWFLGESEKGLFLLGEADPGELRAGGEEEVELPDSVFRKILDDSDVLGGPGAARDTSRSWLDGLRWRTARR